MADFCILDNNLSRVSLDLCENKVIDFGSIPVDTVSEKCFYLENTTNKEVTYRISLMNVMDSIDRVFKVDAPLSPVAPTQRAQINIRFKPTISGQSYTEYYVVDDTDGNNYRLTVMGRCVGPKVSLSRKNITFRICKNVSEDRKELINIINKSCVETTYQWLLPLGGQGSFQISTGNCGLIRAYETITTSINFNGLSLGIYTSELVCLVLNQEPLYVSAVATVVLPGNPLFNINDHVFERNWKRKSRCTHLMENSLNSLPHIPSASVFERYLDFGTGNMKKVTRNISQTLCVTNHQQEEGFIQWVTDPDNVFIIDPSAATIPPGESRMFSVRYRPTVNEDVFGYLLCADFQYKQYNDDDDVKMKHTWFRIPCIGNTWSPCTEWPTEWDCPVDVTMPPTVPTRTTFQNFMLSNKLEIPMFFKFEAPHKSNFVVLPMCGVVQGRGWQIIYVALETKACGYYNESWDVVINKVHRARINFYGNAEISNVEVMSHGYNPKTDAMFEFPPTITGCCNYITSYFHNKTRMAIHMRILYSTSWLGADNGGILVLPPKEVVKYHWWFFPKQADLVYETTMTCSLICLIDGRPVGEPTEVNIHVTGFSELPDLRVLPRRTNLHDVVVGESVSFPVKVYNYGSCFFTSKLYHVIDGMGDDFSGDRLDIDCAVVK